MKSTRTADPYMQFLLANPDVAREIERLNAEGQAILRDADYEGAKAYFERILELCPYSPVGHNNLATTLLHQGDLEQAMHHLMETLRDYPEYVYALATVARVQLQMGRKDEAAASLRQAIDAFRPSNPHRGDEADGVHLICDVLAQLEDDAGFFDFFRRHGGLRRINWPTLARAGVAAFNTGRYAQSQRYWKQAMQRGGAPELFENLSFVADLVDSKQVPPFRLDYDLRPPDVLGDANPDPSDPELTTGAVKAMIVGFIWHGPEQMAGGALDLLGQTPDPWAEELLWTIVQRTSLPQDVKMGAAHALMTRGAVTPGQPFKMNVDGRLREVTVEKKMVPKKSDPKAWLLFEEGVKKQQSGNGKGALRDLQKALELDPSLMRARLSMVFTLQQLGRWDESREELSQINADELSKDELWRYWGMWGECALALGAVNDGIEAFQRAHLNAPNDKKAAVRARLEEVEQLAESDPEEDLYWRMHDERRQRLLSQAVHPGMTIAEAYHCFTRDNLFGTGRRQGLRLAKSLTKPQIIQELVEDFSTRAERAYKSLSRKERHAIKYLRERGGVALFSDFEARYGDPDDYVYWQEEDPSTPANRLWSWGWIAVGTWRGYRDEDVLAYSQKKRSAQSDHAEVAGGRAAKSKSAIIVFLPAEVVELLDRMGV